MDNAPAEQEGSKGTIVIEDEATFMTEMGMPLEEEEETESARGTTVPKDGVLDTDGQRAGEVEPIERAGVPEETQSESIPMETETVSEPLEEAEQPLLTAEEVAANVAAMDSETDERDMEVDGDRVVGWNPTERVENITDEMLENRGVVNMTNDGRETEKVPSRDEAAEARAAAVRTYQRRPAREETSGKRSEEEQPRETPILRTGEDMNNPVGSAVGASRRRRRVIMDEEPEEEEEEVLFTPIDTQPSSGQPDPPTEMEDRERERNERKRKGKAIATPLRKRPKQASTTLVIQEERRRSEEQDDEEDEALRFERRTKRRNDGTRSTSEQRPEMAGIQFEMMRVRLNNELIGRMVTFEDPQLTAECAARLVGQKGKVWKAARPTRPQKA